MLLMTLVHSQEGVCLVQSQYRATRISTDSVALLLKEAEHIKVRLDGLESHMQGLQGSSATQEL